METEVTNSTNATETNAVETTPQADNDSEPTVEELLAQLAAERAANAKNKQALDKALKEKGDVTKALRAKQTAEEQEAEAKAEAERIQNEKYEATVKELNHIKAVAAYKNFSSDNAIESMIEAVADGDHSAIAALIDNEVKAATTAAKAEWMKSRPRMNVGGEYSGMTKEQIMAIPDRAERRRAIAMNPSLFN